MLKKKLLFLSLLFIFFVSSTFAKTPLGDELPDLKKLSNYIIGEKRVLKAIKYESKKKYKKSNKLYLEGLEYFLLANKQDPANPNIYFYLGFTSEKLKKILDAEIYYLLGLEVSPNNTKISNHLGKLYFKNNKINKANEILKILKNCKCEDYDNLANLIR
tara:strand:- start:75 stop:554 length:480 start_codon:yes stop_codon:yes gene_type:complete